MSEKELPSYPSSEATAREAIRYQHLQQSFESYRTSSSMSNTATRDIAPELPDRPSPRHYSTAPPLYRPTTESIGAPPPLPEKSWDQRRYLDQPGKMDNRPASSMQRQSSSMVSTPAGSDDEDDRLEPGFEDPSKFTAEGDGAQTSADVTQDGRIDMVL
jgi:hypothetical protein